MTPWELECPIDRAAEVLETCFYYMNEWPLQRFDWLTLPIGELRLRSPVRAGGRLKWFIGEPHKKK